MPYQNITDFDYYSFQDGVKINILDIEKWINEIINNLKTNEYSFVHSGDTFVAGYNIGLKGYISIYICTKQGVETLTRGN